MCLAIPARVVTIDPATDTATVALGAVTKEVSVALVDDLAPGDYVLIHVGYALSRLSPGEAERTLALMAEVTRLSAEAADLPAGRGVEGTP
jgi:hydrogenase expression/formation protein HypC